MIDGNNTGTESWFGARALGSTLNTLDHNPFTADLFFHLKASLKKKKIITTLSQCTNDALSFDGACVIAGEVGSQEVKEVHLGQWTF